MRLRWIGGGVLAVGGVLAAWGFWLEPSSLVVREYQLEIPTWPAACEGLRIAVLSDLHVGSPYNGLDNLDRIVDETQAATPDLVLLTGDYGIEWMIGGRFVAPEDTAQRLARLSAPLGVYAVLGNHDWDEDPVRYEHAFESAGIPVLDGETRSLSHRSCAFELAGLRDLWSASPRQLARTLRAAAAEDTPVVAFTHNPDMFPRAPASVDLMIAGHTHGGQVAIPWIGPPIVPSRYGRQYAAGHVVENGRHLFVSTGLGTCILPVRFMVPPEVSILVVRSAGQLTSETAAPADRDAM